MADAKVTEQLLAAWQPGLQPIAERYPGEKVILFSGLVAFLGLQLSWWSTWLQACEQSGYQFTPKEREYYLDDPQLHNLPWFAIAHPQGAKVLWVLVRGAGLPPSADTHKVLANTQMGLTLASLDDTGHFIPYGEAPNLLSAWGMWGGREAPIQIPLVHCQALQEEWHLWQQAAVPLNPILGGIVQDLCRQSHVTPATLKLAFLDLAATAWQQLQDKGHIQVGPFRTASWRSLFSRRSSNDKFSGIFLLYGDHKELWQKIK